MASVGAGDVSSPAKVHLVDPGTKQGRPRSDGGQTSFRSASLNTDIRRSKFMFNAKTSRTLGGGSLNRKATGNVLDAGSAVR